MNELLEGVSVIFVFLLIIVGLPTLLMLVISGQIKWPKKTIKKDKHENPTR